MKIVKSNKAVRTIFEASLKAADPYHCTLDHLEHVREVYKEKGCKRLYLLAFGKGASAMCRAVEDHLGDLLTEGIAITKYGHSEKLAKIKLLEASHPLPDMNGVEATGKLIKLLKKADSNSLVLCLISGGGSALLVSPSEGLTLDDMERTTDLLLRRGTDIKELNTVRKHLSRVKGGQLAKMAPDSHIVSLILSDVIGDRLDVIASGPTAPDGSSFGEALQILEKYGVDKEVPLPVIDILKSGISGNIEETPKADDDLFDRVRNIIVGNNSIALEAAKARAEEIGLKAQIRSSELTGEARDVAKEMAAFAIEKKKEVMSGRPLCYISGGETTVTIKGNGKGGRNMELALAFAKAIDGIDGITLLSAGTDGTDGPTDAAGAIVDGQTAKKAKAAGYDVASYLADNDSYDFFKNTEGLIITGPTGTNVMDVQVLVVE